VIFRQWEQVLDGTKAQHTKKGERWADDPEVFALSFELVEKGGL